MSTFQSVFETEADSNKFRDFFGSVEVEYAALPSAFESLFISTPSNTPSRFFSVDSIRAPQKELSVKSIFETSCNATVPFTRKADAEPRGPETSYRVLATVPCVKGNFNDVLCICTVDFDS